MSKLIFNQVKAEAQRVVESRNTSRTARVTGYDPDRYAVKVILLPAGDDSLGWLPVTSQWVGAGWGLFCPPSIGEIVEVQFENGNLEAGYVDGRFFGDKAQPLACPGGEFWVVHKSGSFFKLTNDGKVTVTDMSGASFILNADGTAILNANLIVNGYITATEDITDHIATTAESMQASRAIFNSHYHAGVERGPDLTDTPTPTE